MAIRLKDQPYKLSNKLRQYSFNKRRGKKEIGINTFMLMPILLDIPVNRAY